MKISHKTAIRYLLVIGFCLAAMFWIADSITERKEYLETNRDVVERELDAAIKEATSGLHEAAEFYEQGEYDTAIEKLHELQKKSKMFAYDYYLGLAYYEKKQFPKALEHFDSALENQYKRLLSERSPVLLGIIYDRKMRIAYKAGDYKEILRNCNLAISYSKGEEQQELEELRKAILNVMPREKM